MHVQNLGHVCACQTKVPMKGEAGNSHWQLPSNSLQGAAELPRKLVARLGRPAADADQRSHSPCSGPACKALATGSLHINQHPAHMQLLTCAPHRHPGLLAVRIQHVAHHCPRRLLQRLHMECQLACLVNTWVQGCAVERTSCRNTGMRGAEQMDEASAERQTQQAVPCCNRSSSQGCS